MYYNDKHIVKMQLESAQILCSVVNMSGGHSDYKTTHANHPCTKWARQSIDNWRYLKRLALFMEDEWKWRYEKSKYASHKSINVIRSLYEPLNLPDIGRTPFALAMPDKYKKFEDPIECYRAYYSHEKETYVQRGVTKYHTWTKRDPPEWMDKALYIL